jgi:pimeloyl-ACP methyl ester carboxylesterase
MACVATHHGDRRIVNTNDRFGSTRRRESTGDATDGLKRALAEVVHGLVLQLELHDFVIVGHDVGGIVSYSYLRTFDDVSRGVIMGVVIPGSDPWEDVLRNPYLWHFAMHAVSRLPELPVQGHQGPYFEYFYDAIAAGFVDTPLSARILGDQLESRLGELRATLPVGRFIEPTDVAALAVHLMSNTALIGGTYYCDGGEKLVGDA